MLEIFILLLILGFMAVVAYTRLDRFETPGTKPSNEGTFRAFEPRPSLFVNAQEHEFFQVLFETLPQSYHIHSKVRLEDIVAVRSDIKNPRMRWHLRARVKSRHVDFLITDKDGHFLCAVELDGPIHDYGSTEHADALKDGIFKAVDIPLFRISTQEPTGEAVARILKLLRAP